MNRPIPATPIDLDAPRRYVIGTAGHVDHGKSTLVRALTGIDPDRLAEERERQMTIDLGFAWFTLPGGREVSVIDVPGHERFVGNMLAGVGGFDLALLVVGADDGPMPQTREHLAILDLLDVRRGVVAVTRADLVDDEWRDLVVEEVRELIAPTSLAGSPVIPLSAVTGAGLDDLRAALDGVLDAATPGDANRAPRLPIDRAFAIAGFGTIVTGTLIDGELRTGQELVLQPVGRSVRVRGLQEHQRQVTVARAGSRVAVNLGGVDASDVHRGDVLALPGAITPAMRLDARVRLLPDAPVALEQNDEVIVFTGASELPARVTVLDAERLLPGAEGWVQVRLAAPATTLRGDRLILRRPSPAATIGGGVVVEPGARRHRRFQPEVLHSLTVLAEGTPEDRLLHALGDAVTTPAALGRQTGLDAPLEVIASLIASGEVVPLDPSIDPGPNSGIVRRAVFARVSHHASETLSRHHRERPLSPGIRRDDLRTALGIASQKAFDALLRGLAARELIVTDAHTVAAPGFEIRLDGDLRARADAFLAIARSAPYAPPAPEEHGIGPELVAALVARGEAVRVTAQIVYPAEVFATIRRTLAERLADGGRITLAEYRDLFGTSRKYAQSTLEYLDEIRFTRRHGDERTRYVGPGAAP